MNLRVKYCEIYWKIKQCTKRPYTGPKYKKPHSPGQFQPFNDHATEKYYPLGKNINVFGRGQYKQRYNNNEKFMGMSKSTC